MLGTTSAAAVRRHAAAAAAAAVRVQTRGMATEKQIWMRIQATTNIRKITSSMKMVSASKLRGDQTRLEAGRPFIGFASRLAEDAVDVEEIDTSDWPQKNLVLAVTSDRGLCGGVNSTISRAVRALHESLSAQGKEMRLAVVGEKGRAQLRRQFVDSMDVVISDASQPISFPMASAIAQEVMETAEAEDRGYEATHIVYNTFKSAIAYIPSVKTIMPMYQEDGEDFKPDFEYEPDIKPELLTNLYEYTFASQLYHAMLEAATSEQSSRMNAMENASKNAGEMIDSLTLQYNRARQARITTELIEIISGAAALDG